MPTRQINIENIGLVTVSKLRRSKHLRISVKPDGRIQVSIPIWANYKHAEEFVRQKQDWIMTKIEPAIVLCNGDRIGKGQRLLFCPSQTVNTIRTKIINHELRVTFPIDKTPEDEDVQTAARKLSVKSLKLQSEELLPSRLQTLAARHGFTYNSVQIRQLKGRWGSCSSKRDITLNCYLIQLDWYEIDYVLLHELTHTEFMSHNADFWRRLSEALPSAKLIKKQISLRKPIIIPQH